MAKRNNQTGAHTFFIIVLALILILGFVLILLRFAGKSGSDYESFYISYNGSAYAASDEAWQAPGETLKFDINYIGGDHVHKGYSVKVVSNASDKTDFSYTVDGKAHSFGKQALDFTAAFNPELNADNFTLTMPNSMQEALQTVYPDSAVTVSDGVDLTEQPYFKIVVTAYDKKTQVELYLIAPTFNLGSDLMFY